MTSLSDAEVAAMLNGTVPLPVAPSKPAKPAAPWKPRYDRCEVCRWIGPCLMPWSADDNGRRTLLACTTCWEHLESSRDRQPVVEVRARLFEL